MRSKVVIQWSRCSRVQQLRAVTHALAPFEGTRPNAVVTAFFIHGYDSDIMRHVGGGVLNNPVTRASQSGGGGRIPRAGRFNKSEITQRRLAPYEALLKRRANFDLDHGKATLCSSIHHRGHQNASNKRMVGTDQRRARLDQGSAVPAWRLVQRAPLRWEADPRPSCQLPSALSWIQRDPADRQRLQGLDLTALTVYDASIPAKGDEHDQPE